MLRQSLGNLPETVDPARPLQLSTPCLCHYRSLECPRSVPASRTTSRRKKGPGPQGPTWTQGGLALPLLGARGRVHRGPGPPALPPSSPAGVALGCTFEGCVLLGLVREPCPARPQPSSPHGSRPCSCSAHRRHLSPGSYEAPLLAGVPGVEDKDRVAPSAAERPSAPL